MPPLLDYATREFFPRLALSSSKCQPRKYIPDRGTIQTVGVFRTDRIPSLSRIPKEIGREQRACERCGDQTRHILYQVPKKLIFVYVKDHPNSLQATCMKCAASTVLTGEERENILGSR